MKLRDLAVGASIVVGGIAAACSSKAPVQPPVGGGSDTPLAGGGGAGGTASDEDAGDAGFAPGTSEDAATDASNPCLSLSCLGCCTPTNECLAGNLNTACGFNNARCTTCSGTQTCISGSGCE